MSTSELVKYCPTYDAIKTLPGCRNFLLNVNSAGKYDPQMNTYCKNYNYMDDSICSCINSNFFCPQNNEKNCKNGLGYVGKANIQPCSVCIQNLDQTGSVTSLISATQVCNSGGKQPPADTNPFPVEFIAIAFILFIFLVIVIVVVVILKQKNNENESIESAYPYPQ